MNKKIYFLTTAYFCFLILILIIYGYTPQNDSEGYIEYAKLCLEEHQPYPATSLIEHSSFIWNIGAINIIELSLWLFDSIYPVLVLMCLLKALTAALIAKIAQTLFNDRVAILSSVLFVLYPNNWGQSTMLLSEIPSIFFALSATYITIKTNNIKLLFVSGILLFLSNWFRSIAIVFMLSLILYYLIFERQHILRKICPMLCGLFISILIVGSLSYMRTGHFIYSGNSLWYNMAYNCYDGAKDVHFGEAPYQKGTPMYIENMDELDCFERNDIWKQRCIHWIMDNKMEYLKKIPKRIILMYQNDIDNIAFALKDKSNSANNYVTIPIRNMHNEIGNLSGVQYLALISFIIYVCILLLFLYSIIVSINNNAWRNTFIPLAIIIIGTASISLLIHGETRFKVPFMPFIFILASYGLTSIKTLHKKL